MEEMLLFIVRQSPLRSAGEGGEAKLEPALIIQAWRKQVVRRIECERERRRVGVVDGV
jgi:hypothetical protein